jgi:hypothetical protein
MIALHLNGEMPAAPPGSVAVEKVAALFHFEPP